MGLIARELEANGIATVSLSCALSITRSVNPPRAVFFDAPLGQTAGPAGDADAQLALIRRALAAVTEMRTPGSIEWLPLRLADPAENWKTEALEGGDDRVERHDAPQYQHDADARAADPACPTCVFFE